MVSLSHLTVKPAIKNSGQLLLSPPESLPLSLSHLRCSTMQLSFFLLVRPPSLHPPLFFSSRHYHYLINIQPPTPGLVSFPSLLHQSPILLTLLFLSTSFPFPSFPLFSSCFFFFFFNFYVRQSVIWPWLMYSFSRDGVETRCRCKNWFFLSYVFSVFLIPTERERALEKHAVLLPWVMMSLVWSPDLSLRIVSMFVARRDNLISSFGCGVITLLNQVCQKEQGTDWLPSHVDSHIHSDKKGPWTHWDENPYTHYINAHIYSTHAHMTICLSKSHL